LWWGVLAPAGTPDPILDRLHDSIDRILQSDDMKAFFLKEGALPVLKSRADFGKHLADEIKRWKVIAATADIQPE